MTNGTPVRSRGDYSAIEAVDASGIRPTVSAAGIGNVAGDDAEIHHQRSRSAASGNAAMLGRLTELMFVEILRDTYTGFPRSTAFNRAFKRATGSPPATWRKGALLRE